MYIFLHFFSFHFISLHFIFLHFFSIRLELVLTIYGGEWNCPNFRKDFFQGKSVQDESVQDETAQDESVHFDRSGPSSGRIRRPEDPFGHLPAAGRSIRAIFRRPEDPFGHLPAAGKSIRAIFRRLENPFGHLPAAGRSIRGIVLYRIVSGFQRLVAGHIKLDFTVLWPATKRIFHRGLYIGFYIDALETKQSSCVYSCTTDETIGACSFVLRPNTPENDRT